MIIIRPMIKRQTDNIHGIYPGPIPVSVISFLELKIIKKKAVAEKMSPNIKSFFISFIRKLF
jgi:hypothetical protein